MRGVACCAVAVLLMTGGAACAEPSLVVSLTSHQVTVVPGFHGGTTVLSGTAEGPGDIVVVVRGPERAVVVRRKSLVAGLWLDTRSVTFAGVPGYAAFYATAPLAAIVPAALQAQHQIGANNLRFQPVSTELAPALVERFRAALIADREKTGLYAAPVGFLGVTGHRFETTLAFPANAPAGPYFIEVLLIRDKAVVSGQTMSLEISRTGLEARAAVLVEHRPFIAGALAVAVAAAAGLFAGIQRRS